jgi:Fibronectin type III domain
MRRVACALVLGLGLGASLEAATAVWDANAPAENVTGYRLQYGTTSGQPTVILDVGNVTTVPLPTGLVPGTAYFFTVVAYNAAGQVSAPSTEVAYTPAVVQPPPDPCSFPLGANAVQIFPTGALNKTGSGGAGSKFFITFQAASPNSPIVYLSIRANGIDIPDSIGNADGAPNGRLTPIGSLWATMPSGPATYTFSVFARNAAGCTRDQSTGFSQTLP